MHISVHDASFLLHFYNKTVEPQRKFAFLISMCNKALFVARADALGKTRTKDFCFHHYSLRNDGQVLLRR